MSAIDIPCSMPIAEARANAATDTPMFASASVMRVAATEAVAVAVVIAPYVADDLTDHHVVHEAAVFVAGDDVLARLRKRDGVLADVAWDRDRVGIGAHDLEDVDEMHDGDA